MGKPLTVFDVNTGERTIPQEIEAINTPITTVGAGVLTAAAIAGGIITRSGPTAGFTDTTDTAAAIIAAQQNIILGQSWNVQIRNTVAFDDTLAAGTGVTLSGVTVVPANSIGNFLVTYTGAGAISMLGLGTIPSTTLPPAKFTSINVTAGTLAAGVITGAAFTSVLTTNATPGAQTVRTAAQMLADIPGGYVGLSYILRITNSGAGTLTLTADGGATVTLTGTMTVPTNTWREFVVTFNTATTATIQSIGTGTI